MKERTVPHLRLVVAAGKGEDARPHPPGAFQLSFPYPEPSSVTLLQLQGATPDLLPKMVEKLAPHLIFDVRVTPHLDVIAKSRAAAFSLFSQRKITYIDLFGRLSINSYHSVDANPSFWAPRLSEFAESTPMRGPYLFLFDNLHLMEATLLVLPNVFQRRIDKKATFSVVLSSRL